MEKESLIARLIGLVVVTIFVAVTFLNLERHAHEKDLELIMTGDLVMCTAEKIPAGADKAVLHVVAAMSVVENAVETRKLHGFILNNDAVVNGVVGYEELHNNCEGEVMFLPAKSKQAWDVGIGITTKGLPLEITYTPSPPLPTQSF